MNEDEIADMFRDECLYNAGIIDKSPFDDEEEEITIRPNQIIAITWDLLKKKQFLKFLFFLIAS